MAETHSESGGHASQFGHSRPVTLTANVPSDTDVKPNRGRSIPDKQAIEGESESLASWRRRKGIDPSTQIKLVKLTHMRYQHPDIPTITKFLKDFGMQVAAQAPGKVWFRGYGPDPYVYYAQEGEKEFLGGTFEVESYAELEKAARLLPGAGDITELTDAPGGGHMITVHDPEGFPLNLIHGQTPAGAAPEAELPGKIVYNSESDKPRVRRFNRFTPGPAAVHKLGHYGLCVRDFAGQAEWYTRTFNLAPTDFLYVQGGEGDGERREVGLFAHIDRGTDPVDHHTFFMAANPTSHVHHASFEVHDYDTQHLGHQWLGRQGYESVWGIGRHILGSQIFDYWWDTSRFMIEHYADGDLVNEETPVGWGMAGDESLAVWGPDVPKGFLD